MKKLIAGLIAAFVMAAGLVTVSGGTANAACAYNAVSCPPVAVAKPAGVGTTPETAPVTKVGKTKTLAVKFTAPKGTKGTVKIKITGPKKVSKSFKNVKSGAKKKLKTPKLKKKGTYKVTITITPTGKKVSKKTVTYYFKVA